MVGRIATMTNQSQLITQMLRTQDRVFDLQTQVGTEKKSQNYLGIATDSFRLVNLENDSARVDRYIRNNLFVETDLESMQTATISANDRMIQLRNAMLEFTGRDLSGQGPEVIAAVDNIQQEAFSALNDMEFLLNLRVDGKFLFGGGVTDRVPASIPFDNATQFQDAFDGVNVTYPETRVAALNRQDFSVAAANYSNPVVGGGAVGQITGAANEFVTQTFNETDFGDIDFTTGATTGTIAAGTTGAFSTLEVGMSFFVDGSDTATGDGVTDNNGVYTITAISADGSTLTVEPPPPNTGTDTAAGSAVEIKLTYPNGSTIQLNDSALGNDGFYTVNWPTNADLVAAGIDPNAAGNPVADGTRLFLNSTLTAGGPEAVEVEGYTYYNGDNLQRSHRINEANELVIGVTGEDPGFEKAIRGIGILLQGDLINNPERALQALNLINESIDNVDPNSTEEPGDLQDISTRIAINQSVVNREIDRLRDFRALIDTRITELENVDVTEAAVRLNDEVRSLEISFATLSRIQQLSLNNFI